MNIVYLLLIITSSCHYFEINDRNPCYILNSYNFNSYVVAMIITAMAKILTESINFI